MQVSQGLIEKCKHPVRIPDVTRPGHYLYVPCGHCVVCHANRRNAWMRRIFDECSYSKYVMFFTLTYDNFHVPKAFVHPNRQVYTTHDGCVNYVSSIFDCYDYPKIQKYPRTDCFAYARKGDVQNFLKRLRRRLAYDKDSLCTEVKPSDRFFRYFIVSEYGSQTFRPHYHGLLFFTSREAGIAAEKYLRACWKLCSSDRVDCSEVISNAPKYVAKYICCDSTIPAALKHKSFAPFYLFSRSPSIGSRVNSDEDIQERIYQHKTSDCKTIVSKNGTKSVDVPVSKSSFCRFFTKPLLSYQFDSRDLFQFASEAIKFTCEDLEKYTVSYGISKYRIGEFQPDGTKIVWSNSAWKMSDIERSLCVPQNRHFVRNVRYCVFYLGMSIYEYCYLFTRMYSELASDCISFQAKTFNYLYSKGYSMAQLVSFIYPDFVATLPKNLMSVSREEACNIELCLNSFNLTLADVYDFNWNLNDVFVSDFHGTSIYHDYLYKLKQDQVEFDKTRMHNFFTFDYKL